MPPSPRSLALRLLSRRDYTAAELREALIDRDCSKDEVEEVVARLIADRLIDDRRVANAHVRTATAIKKRGRIRIARELEARGLDRTLIRDVLATVPAEDEAAAIAQILKQKRVPAALDAAAHRRIYGHLMRRGFSADAIGKALRSRSSHDVE